MLDLGLAFPADRPARILLLGAHADDIEIGCGGTVLELIRRHANVEVDWVVFSGIGPRADEANRAASRFLANARKANVRLFEFRDGFFPYDGAEIKAAFESLKGDCQPDLVFTHYRQDLHQDHRLVNELTWNTFRNHLILEYEIPKFDGDLGVPNAFAPLTPATCDAKIEALMECYGTQRDKFWFTDETFRSILRLRGVEARSETGYAEAFYARKISILGGAGEIND
jgi:LmbE family N-acetylglucosaminyl deacetylase